nr:Vam6/Vps39-like protein [Tanacetum cinerariifolium]
MKVHTGLQLVKQHVYYPAQKLATIRNVHADGFLNQCIDGGKSDSGRSDGGRSDGGRSDYDTDDVIEEGSSAIMLDEVLDVLIQRWDRVHGAKALRLLPKETKLQNDLLTVLMYCFSFPI